jgi:hypothetical protein
VLFLLQFGEFATAGRLGAVPVVPLCMESEAWGCGFEDGGMGEWQHEAWLRQAAEDYDRLLKSRGNR